MGKGLHEVPIPRLYVLCLDNLLDLNALDWWGIGSMLGDWLTHHKLVVSLDHLALVGVFLPNCGVKPSLGPGRYPDLVFCRIITSMLEIKGDGGI